MTLRGLGVNAKHGVPIRLAKLARFFQNSAHMKTTTLPLRNLMNRSLLRAVLVIALASFALAPQARADNCEQGCGFLFRNTFVGQEALVNNIGGLDNTAIGFYSLNSNTTGDSNTANGAGALLNNTTGSRNVATGASVLYSNQTGSDNTATGTTALYYNTGNYNTANGYAALLNNTMGGSNIALGFQAGINLTTGSNNIDIANVGVAGENNKIRIGTKPTHKNTYIAGIFGVTVPTGIGVLIDNSGHLGTTTSSARFKDDIKRWIKRVRRSSPWSR